MKLFVRLHMGVLALMLGLFLAAGCAPVAPEVPTRAAARRQTAPQAVAEPTTITWSFWGDPWEVEINRRVARAFEGENPSIKVEMIQQPWEQYFTWLEDRWRQGDAPDVMFLNNIRGYAVDGHLEPLGPYIQRDRFDLSDFYPRLLDLFNYRGEYYGLPRDNDTKVIYYNKTLFSEAGLEPPRSGWTWTELRNLAARLTRRDSVGRPTQYGFAFETDVWWRLWAWQNGGDILDDPFEPTRVRIDEPASVDAIQFLSDLINADRVTPPLGVMRSSSLITKLFQEGRVAMAFGGHGKIPILAEEPALKWDVAGLPQRVQRVNLAGGAGYTISAQSQKKEAAWSFVRFLESEKGQALFSESGLVVPARRSVREDNIFVRQQPYSVRVFADETEFGRPNLNIPRAGEINRLADAFLAPVWRGERTASDALSELAPQIGALIGR